ncbi:MAG: multidrug effflux MFS transporter [Cardiobacteriaceae bacterium]|nr:multidrug effflux MFS transporter [Cardiobacteriaceae bacterium]
MTTNSTDRRIAFLIASMSAIMPFSIDAYLPAVTAIAQQLGVGESDVQQNLSRFMIGQALGLLCGGTLSDWRGRRPVVLLGLMIYCLASLAMMFFQTLDQFLMLRLLQAFGAGMAAVNGAAIVRDNYEGQSAAQMFAMIAMIIMGAPLIAPMIGWVMMTIGGWRAIFVFLFTYATLVLTLQWRFLPANRVTVLAAPLWHIVIRRYWHIFTTREALGFLFMLAFAFGSMFCYLHESPFVYVSLFGLSEGAYTLVFAMNIVTMTLCNRLTALLLKRGKLPKNILLLGIALQCGANLLLVLVSQMLAQPPAWLYMGLVALSVGAHGIIGANTQACYMSYFKAEGASANGVLLSMMAFIAGAIGGVVHALHDGTIRMMPLLMLSSTLCGIVILFFFSRRVWLRKA